MRQPWNWYQERCHCETKQRSHKCQTCKIDEGKRNFFETNGDRANKWTKARVVSKIPGICIENSESDNSEIIKTPDISFEEMETGSKHLYLTVPDSKRETITKESDNAESDYENNDENVSL